MSVLVVRRQANKEACGTGIVCTELPHQVFVNLLACHDPRKRLFFFNKLKLKYSRSCGFVPEIGVQNLCFAANVKIGIASFLGKMRHPQSLIRKKICLCVCVV